MGDESESYEDLIEKLENTIKLQKDYISNIECQLEYVNAKLSDALATIEALDNLVEDIAETA